MVIQKNVVLELMGNREGITTPDTGGAADEILGHLRMIEFQYNVRIMNKKEIAGVIISRTRNRITILSIALSLNHWVAVKGVTGNIEIPERVLNSIIKQVLKKRVP